MSRTKAPGWEVLHCDWPACTEKNPATEFLATDGREFSLNARRSWAYLTLPTLGFTIDLCPEHEEKMAKVLEIILSLDGPA